MQGKQTKCFPLGSNAKVSIYLDIFDKLFCFSDFVLSSLSCPVKATALLSNFVIVVRKSNNQVRTHQLIIRNTYHAVTNDGIFGVDLSLPVAYHEAKLLVGGTYLGLTVWGQDTDCPLIITSQSTNENASLLVIGDTKIIS